MSILGNGGLTYSIFMRIQKRSSPRVIRAITLVDGGPEDQILSLVSPNFSINSLHVPLEAL
jgi:hypothetical protein